MEMIVFLLLFIPMLPQYALSGTSSDNNARRKLRSLLFTFQSLQRSSGFRA